MPVMPIPDDWDGVSWCCVPIDWPASAQWQAILLGFVTTPQTGRFWDERTGSIVAAQDIGREITARNLCLWGNNQMGCFESLVEELRAIRDVISVGMLANTCGCSGSFGADITPADPSTYTDNGANYPEPYSDRAAYLDAKCKIAELIRQRMISTLVLVRQLQPAGIAVAILAGILTAIIAFPVAYVATIAFAAAILDLTAISIGTFVLAIEEAIAYWEDTFDVCLIYDASSTTDAIDRIKDDIDAQAFTVDVLTKNAMKLLVTTDVLNWAFGPLPTTINPEALPVGDCSACTGPSDCGYNIVTGSGADYPGGVMDSAIDGSGFGTIQLEVTSDSCATQAVTLTLISISHPSITHINVQYVDALLGPVGNNYDVASLMAGITFNTVSWSNLGVDWFFARENAGGRSFQVDLTFAPV